MNNNSWYCLMASSNSWHVYIVECADGSLYTGITKSLTRRVAEHNCGNRGAKYTRARRPVKLVYHQLYPDRSTALKAESKFKKLSRSEKILVIKEFEDG